MNVNNVQKYIVKPSNARKFVTSLGKTGAILPVILLEATVTGGRTYQAYQRDGFVEARERVTEESLGAVFWLFGATMFGKAIDVVGKKLLKMPKEHYDVGKDPVRQSFNNFILDHKNDPKYNKDLLAKFKFGKIIASLIAACAFIGYVVPKMNQAITRNFFQGRIEPEKKLDPRMEKMYEHFHHKANISINSVQNFKSTVMFGKTDDTTDKNAASVENNKKQIPSFKGAEFFTTMAQNFEQNAIYKLLGTDVGTVTGRAANARNKDERVEILFRDISSIYFYCFSTGAILSFLNNKDVFKGNNTRLNPDSAMQVHNHLINKMNDMKKPEMSVEAFRKFALGEENIDKTLYEKFFPKQEAKPDKKYFFGLFKKKAKKEFRVINIEEYNKIIDANITDSTRASELKDLGLRMSGLQAEQRIEQGGKVKLQKILTESQVEDILRGGEIRKPEFMKDALNKIYGSKSHPNRIADPYTYIQQSEIEGSRQQILDYVESILGHAKKENKTKIDWESMMKVNKRNINRNALYWGTAMGVSALFLSTIIPKVQYWITKMRTGRDGFPGIENMRAQQKAEQDKKAA